MDAPRATLVLLTISSLLLTTASAADPLYTQCSDTGGTYTASDRYSESLTKLIATIQEELSWQPPYGFAAPAIQNGSETIVNGLAQCRHDVPNQACLSCAAEAAAHLRRACPTQKEAITWYDNCMVRYAPRDFYEKVEDTFRVYVRSNETVPDAASFNPRVVTLLRRVSSEAYGNEFWRFGTEEADVVVGRKKEKVYSMAQCTMDLKPKSCQTCLLDILADFPKCCDGKRGGRVVTASCSFRYESERVSPSLTVSHIS